ncbi:MAG: Co2+/Mg2+ efflux protein ApaG [Bacteroidetes bacterium]|nr:Co2+/Mg2+ efflux protein ApaG [Bacteroidota bacterium]GDX47646.1 protein ApaG [Bacteroidota bacterium]
MLTKITNGVKISVETFYQPEYSQPLNNEFMFAYRITISNESEYTVKLLRRNWVVFDSNGVVREVEGDGVVGQQPVIEPGESHQYVSGSHLRTEMGKMKGFYTMERLIDGKLFKVEIPEFPLLVPFKMN